VGLLPHLLKMQHDLTIEKGSLYVWSGLTNVESQILDAYVSVLSVDEIGRADRFRFEKDRSHFVVTRGVLRYLLSAYTGLPAQEIAFEYGPKGKPELAHNASKINFNVSHSHGMGVWAIAFNGVVGVDVEYVKRSVDIDAVGKRFFSDNEWRHLRDLPEDERRQSFFRCWTRKEAFVKALGDGLTFSLKAFDVTVGDVAQLKRVEGMTDHQKWTLQTFEPAPDFVGALAFEGQQKVCYKTLTTNDSPV
jgi:4'-phosphopantetheinyl transferase